VSTSGSNQPVIVIADDETHIRLVVSDRFKTAGFRVIECGDGEEALEAVREHLPDALVTDLQMPYMSGLELCTRLATSAQTAGIPAVLLTARGHIIEPELVSKTIIRRVMAKPFSAKDVFKTVCELIGVGVETPVQLPTARRTGEAA
jgi:CheY-like chemotaxis protein